MTTADSHKHANQMGRDHGRGRGAMLLQQRDHARRVEASAQHHGAARRQMGEDDDPASATAAAC